MNPMRAAIFSCLALVLGACSGGELTIESTDGDVGTIALQFLPGRAAEHQLPFDILPVGLLLTTRVSKAVPIG